MIVHNMRPATSQQARDGLQEKPSCGLPSKSQPGDDRAGGRLRDQWHAWELEYTSYIVYVLHVRGLLALNPDPSRPLRKKGEVLVAELSAGDNNTIRDLQHHIVGPPPGGPALDAAGHLDPVGSFRQVDNFELLASQRERNNPQSALSSKPIDYIASVLPDVVLQHRYWLYGDEDHRLFILTDPDRNIVVRPVAHLQQDQGGNVRWSERSWALGFPLQLFEDSELHLSAGRDCAAWLSVWHTEREWMHAVHRCEYSNAVIGITEELSGVAANVPGRQGVNPILLRFERRRRELMQADFHVFASGPLELQFARSESWRKSPKLLSHVHAFGLDAVRSWHTGETGDRAIPQLEFRLDGLEPNGSKTTNAGPRGHVKRKDSSLALVQKKS